MANTPQPFEPSKFREKYGITFSEFKRMVNDMDESVWGKCLMYVGNDSQCPVVDLSFSSGLPAAPVGSSAARWYGAHEAIPAKVSVQFMTPAQIAEWKAVADKMKGSK